MHKIPLSLATPEIYLCFGDISLCQSDIRDEHAMIHACKEPCHRHACNYNSRSLDTQHPHYLAYENGYDLYLNMIDPPVPLFQIESFQIALEFARVHIPKRPLYIHCNKGQSRAPSLTLLIMAKILKILPNESYVETRTAFEMNYPYMPGKGIETFLSANWTELN